MKTSHLLIFIAICVGIGALLFNADFGDNTETDVTSNTTSANLSVGGTSTPVDTEAAATTTSSVKVFNISGVNFEFDVEEMRVKKGDTVTVNFTSADGFHDLVIDEFNARTERLRPENGVGTVTFVADKAGTFEYYCSVGQHRMNGMVGEFIVEE